MRALLSMALVAGCSSNASGTPDAGVEGPYWLDDRGVDLGVGDDRGGSPACFRQQDCDDRGCVTTELFANGRCIELCAKPPGAPDAVTACKLPQRCLYSPGPGLGLCLTPCKTNADCLEKTSCQLLDKRLAHLGGVCIGGKATDTVLPSAK